ncbi:bacitracin ABC transporter ATP-binding protein [Bacillus manliponensis]|uniref:Bacitracin ABC transporter ATP-binding protein n=1 Tax=Bacillus manliponensis TaxID=574376 RepID=A0A073JTU7_9BACI|nr:ABC transporter ATP-binding protein [Bacillus manliponensis]KEK17662.1 bacitracin ABC transporter ATP-binding protein [Bacillus manliponensis]
MEEVLHIKNVTKVYEGKVPHTALKNINLHIDKGEFVAIMGPSGSGKSTLLNVISTIDSPTAGEVFINGKQPHTFRSEKLAIFRRQKLGFVFQSFNLLDTLTIGENIVLPLTLDNVPLSEMDQKLDTISTKLGIDHILNKRIFEVSGGQAQRTAVARAVIHNPALILADEPTGNLDSKAATDVMELFTKLNKEEESTILMVTHDPFAASYCSRVIFIKDGELYNELHRGQFREKFYQEILDVLALLGGRRT